VFSSIARALIIFCRVDLQFCRSAFPAALKKGIKIESLKIFYNLRPGSS
jgi:hypothetical protein